MRALILRRVGLHRDRGGRPGDRRPRGARRRPPAGGIPHAQRAPAPTARPRRRRRREDPARALPRRPARAPDRALPERTDAAQSRRGRARPLHRPLEADRSRESLRRSHRRRGTGGSRRRRLRGVRGALGAGGGLPRLRRPGGRFRADRELPRLSDRNQRPGPDGASLQPGAEVRGRDGDPGRGRAPSVPPRRRRTRASRSVLPTGSAPAPAPW